MLTLAFIYAIHAHADEPSAYADTRDSFYDWLSGANTWQDPLKIHELSPYAKQLLSEAFKDLPGIVDTHLHLVCKEDRNGCFVPKKLFSFGTHPILSMKTQVMMSSLGVLNDESSDDETLTRLFSLIRSVPDKPYLSFLFAFAATYDPHTHQKNLSKTGLEVSNAYLSQVVAKIPDRLVPVYSLHPFQADLKNEFAKLGSPRFFKLLPNSMHVDPSDERCEPFFRLLAENRAILITHSGIEHSVEGGGINNDFGNPMLFDKWLQRFPNLRIVFAHAGGAGKSRFGRERKDNVEWVLELMRKYPAQTFADISAYALAPNLTQHLPLLLAQKDLHARFLYGSDYPLSAIKPLLSASLWLMYAKDLLGGFLEFQRRYHAILEVYNYNPLLSSVLVMRLVEKDGLRFPPEVFYKNARGLLEGYVPAPH